MSYKGFKHTTEWKRRASARISGANHPFFGKTFTDEHLKHLSLAHKGKIPWNKGGTHTPEARRKISLALTGRHHTEEARRHMVPHNSGTRMLGKKHSDETKKKMSLSAMGRERSPETRAKLKAWAIKRLANPENHPNWKGGKSFEPYPSAFNRKLKKRIKERDGHSCQECHEQPKILYVHHIDYDKNNCVESNLITLCCSCHAQTNYERNDWTAYFKDKMSTLK